MGKVYDLLVRAKGDTKQAQRAMRQLSSSSRKLKDELGLHFGAIAKTGALAFGVGLAATIKAGVDEMADSQKVAAQTAAVLKSTGGAAKVTSQHVNDLAQSILNYSGIDDEAVQAGENMLLTFTNIRNQAGKNNDIFDQSTRILADMSTALGQDMSKSAIQLGKALNDPVKGITALRRVGVTFTDQQKQQIAAMVKSGHTMEAQKVILKELNREFGGSAKAYGNTLPGLLGKLKESYANLAQTLLAAVLPSLTSVAMKAADFVGHVQAWTKTAQGQQALEKLRRALVMLGNIIVVVSKAVLTIGKKLYEWRNILVPVASGILAIVAAMKVWRVLTAGLAVAQAALNAVLSANPIGLIVLALIGLGTALVVAYKRVKWFRDGVNATFNFLKHTVTATISFVGAHWKLIGSILGGPIVALPILVITHFNRILKFLGSMDGKIANATAGMWDGIKDAFRSAINWVIRGWNSLRFTMPSIDTHIPKVGKVGGFSVGVPSIPYLAHGGLVTRPTLAMIGEAGPEAVIPLSKASNMIRPVQITQNFHGAQPSMFAASRSAAFAFRTASFA